LSCLYSEFELSNARARGKGKAVIKLNVPYAEKDEARRLGARWNAELKTWYAPAGSILTTFERWLPKFDLNAPRAGRRRGKPKQK
jgi:hypothetical protein